MADTAISGLPDGSAVQTTDQLAVNRSGSNFRVVVGALAPLNNVSTARLEDDAVTTAKINNDAVTFPKMQNIATQTLMGRTTAATGDPEALTATQTRTLLNVEDGSTADQVAADVPFTPAGDIAATDVQAALAELDTDKSAVTRTINAQTGTAFTPALTDSGDIITMDNASANVLTVPTNAAVAFTAGTQLDVSQLGSGVTTITGDTGVTVNAVSAGSGAISAQFGSVTLLKLATNTWLLTGNHDAVA